MFNVMQVAIHIANSEPTYKSCYDLMDAEGVDRNDVKLSLPTVMALDPDTMELIGFLGTHYQDNLIIAGPMVLKEKNIMILWRLCEAYESAMRALGITQYIMSVEDGNIMDLAIKRYDPPGMEKYAREGNRDFYVRRLNHGH